MPLTRFRLDIPGLVMPAAGGHLLGDRMITLGTAVGAQMDACADQAFAGRIQAIPFAGGANATRTGAAYSADGRLLECEPFVLPILAAQRGIRLWQTEPLLSQRVRVARWQQIRASFGRHEGQLRNLQPWWLPGTLPTIRIVHQSNEGTPTATWHTLDPSGVYSVVKASPSNWNFDGAPSKSSRWWAVIYLPPGGSLGAAWDAGQPWDGGALWGFAAQAAVADWIGMLLEAKGAGSRLAGVWVTDLQPGDDIPGHAGRHAFDPTDTAIQDAAGWTSLPIGNWGSAVYAAGPYLGLGTRFPFAELVYLDNP